MTLFFWGILIFYILFILWVLTGFLLTPEFQSETSDPKTRFSLIIPFKNEADNLPVLLQSLQALDYPDNLHEIILVDDHSTDKSAQIVQQYAKIKYVINKANGKKQALETGITEARLPYIITIDADCTLPSGYLKTLDAFTNKHRPKMILGPVKFFSSNRFMIQFQQLEFLSLQALTIAGVYWQKPFLANGANLIFDRQTFFEVEAYKGNKRIASGDDVFLLSKFAKSYPNHIRFIKSKACMVQTQAPQTWHELLQQKVRWASKSKVKGQQLSKMTGLLIFTSNIAVILALFTGKFWFVAIKFLFDFILIWQLNKFYKTPVNWLYFIAGLFLYPFYLIVVLLASIKGGYVWKGRRIKV